MKHLYLYFIVIISLIANIGCEKETSSLEIPSEFVYNKSQLRTLKSFDIKNGVATESSQTPFTFEFGLLRDSLELVMNQVFKTGQVLSFKFQANNVVEVLSFDGNENITLTGTYSEKDNAVTISSLESISSFNDSFDELYLCAEIFILKGTTSIGQPLYFSEFDFCSSRDANKSVQNIMAKYSTVTFENIGLAYIDLVYKRK